MELLFLIAYSGFYMIYNVNFHWNAFIQSIAEVLPLQDSQIKSFHLAVKIIKVSK